MTDLADSLLVLVPLETVRQTDPQPAVVAYPSDLSVVVAFLRMAPKTWGHQTDPQVARELHIDRQWARAQNIRPVVPMVEEERRNLLVEMHHTLHIHLEREQMAELRSHSAGDSLLEHLVVEVDSRTGLLLLVA
jgi:hypothetical protein